MNRKFYFGLMLVITGSSALGAVLTLYITDRLAARKSKSESSPSISAQEMIAMLKASKIVMDKAQGGGYDHIEDKDAAIRSDYEFYKMTLLMED